jgi:hypothetical protein
MSCTSRWDRPSDLTMFHGRSCTWTPPVDQARGAVEPRCLRAGAVRRGARAWLWLLTVVSVAWLSHPSGQQLLDRVVARVGSDTITLTDVEAAVGLGVVDVGAASGPEAERSAVAQLIDRRLLLLEVARFPPPEPPEPAVEELAVTMKERAGARFDALLQSTGLDWPRVRELARDTLRIQAYLNQRFGTAGPVSEQEVRDYYESHRQEFTRDGVLAPFEQVEAAAQQGASAERRRRTIAQWLRDRRARGDVIEVTPRTPQF